MHIAKCCKLFDGYCNNMQAVFTAAAGSVLSSSAYPNVDNDGKNQNYNMGSEARCHSLDFYIY